MNDLQDIRALEQQLIDQGVPLRHVRPYWVSLYRKLGLRPKPPVLFSLGEHFVWEGTTAGLCFLFGGILSVTVFGTDLEALVVLPAMAVAIPLYNWLRFRKVRARSGQSE